MTLSSVDLCVQFHVEGNSLNRIIGLQVDNIVCTGFSSFVNHDEKYSSEFPNKSGRTVTNEIAWFNVVDLSLFDRVIFMEQAE